MNGSLGTPISAGSMKYRLKRMGRSALAPLLYRYPPFALAPERLYVLLHYLIATKDVPGPIVEVGCHLGGTAIIAKRLLKGLRVSKPYVCIDTFDGFIGDQFATDAALGTPMQNGTLFSGNSKDLVAKILRQHGCSEVTLVQGDIITLPETQLPDGCSLVLADVDLTEPTYAAISRFLPRMAPGGVILVDDCGEASSWKARIGYSRACREAGREERFLYEMGIIQC
ncbi:MAG TPA: class I SAM-dependent methyltransferase [Xanthobacteraceae bacterium]|nr:class I SAM-dependent methyltransferase [Xanthobacteraceae bacterium]